MTVASMPVKSKMNHILVYKNGEMWEFPPASDWTREDFNLLAINMILKMEQTTFPTKDTKAPLSDISVIF